MDTLTIVTSVAGAALSGGGMAAIVSAFAKRRVTKAEATEKLTDSALDLFNAAKAQAEETRTAAKADINEARKEAAEARREAADARREATEAHRQMQAIKDEAEALAGFLRRLVSAIHDPYVTLERLRAMTGEPGTNGAALLKPPELR